MEVVFYGVRGSCPCSGPAYRRFGGNTACIEVRIDGDDPLILDLGTGARALGDALDPRLRKEGRPLRATALLTHLHFDHILGLPFFRPLRDPGSCLEVHGPRQKEGTCLDDVVHSVVQPPFFPIEMKEFRGEVTFRDTGDEDFAVGTAKVRARFIPHSGPTLGYRIEAEGRVLAYLSDHQAPLDRLQVSDGVLELCDGADLVVHDAQYSNEEFLDHADWGHSTPAYAVRVAARAGAKRLVLFHHDPSHTDRALERLLAEARRLPDAKALEDVWAAHEGWTVDLGRSKH